MKNTRTLALAFLVATSTATVVFAQSASAQYGNGGLKWKSSSGNLLVTLVDRWASSCARGTAQATYQVSQGVRGSLYPSNCNSQNFSEEEPAPFRFEDTAGRERCVGSMLFDRVRSEVVAADTTWVIEKAVPGFRCSTAGQTFKVRVFYDN